MNQIVTILALAGTLGAVIAYSLLTLRFNINVSVFVSKIDELMVAGNIDRAIKLCSALPGPVTVRGVEAVLTMVANDNDDADSGSIRQAYEEAEKPVRQAIQRTVLLAAASGAAAVVAVAAAFLTTKDPAVFRTWQGLVPISGALLAGLAVLKAKGLTKASKEVETHMVEKAIGLQG